MKRILVVFIILASLSGCASICPAGEQLPFDVSSELLAPAKPLEPLK